MGVFSTLISILLIYSWVACGRGLREDSYSGLLRTLRTLKQCLALAKVAQQDRLSRNLSVCFAQDCAFPKFVADLF